jgi:hypothetical protein
VTQQPRGEAPDPIGDFQRWLLRSGAKGMSREVGGHIAGAFGLGGRSGDVWHAATAPPPQDAPECAWCPVCRAARLLRENSPGLASHVAAASNVLARIVQDASAVVDSVLSAASQRPGQDQPGSPDAGVTDAAPQEAGAPGGAAGTRWVHADAEDVAPAGSEWDLATRGNGKEPGTGSGPAEPPG